MEKNNNLLYHAIQWGIILGIIRILIDVIAKVLDVSSMVYYSTSLIGFVVEILIIIYVIKVFRDKLNNGNLSISQAIKMGLIMMIIVAIFLFIIKSFFEPDFEISKSIEMVEKYQPEKLDEVMEKVSEAKENPQYIKSFAFILGWFMFLGLLISSITGAIMKKEETAF